MKKNILFLLLVGVLILTTSSGLYAQDAVSHIVNVQQVKVKWPENGSMTVRDSLLQIYLENVIKKNQHILSHREFSHWFTGSSTDYLVIEEYADMAGMEAAFERNTELEKLAWPDEMKRKDFFKALDGYFDSWHGDALYRFNPKLSKN